MESSRLVEFACEILPGYDVRQKSYGFQKFRHKGSGLRPPTKRCELPLLLAALGQAVCGWKALDLGSLNMQFQPDWPKDKQITALLSFYMKTEKFRSTEVNDAPLEGSTIFL